MQYKLIRMGLVSSIAIGALAACSSSGGTEPTAGGSSAGGSSAAPTGSPITVMTVYPDQSQGSNYPGIPLVAKAYENYINGKGGIGGHRLQVITCNDKNDATQAATCARQAVSAKAVAVVGSFSLGSGQVLPILQAAGIPWLGSYALDPADFSNPDSYPIIGGPIGFSATGVQAGKDTSCKKTDLINFDIAAAAGLTPFIKQGLQSAGKDVGAVVKVPLTTTDFSSTVAAAKEADCIIASLPDAFIQAYLAKAQTLGVKQKLYVPAGTFASGTLKNFASQLEGSAILSPFASPTDDVWADFRAATSSQKAVDPKEFQSLDTWVSYVVFNAVASKVTGPITAATFKAALDKANAVDTGGLTPTLDFTKPFPLAPLARITDTKLLTLRITGGEYKPEGDFVDYRP